MASIAPQSWLSCQQELNTICEHKIMQYSKLITGGKITDKMWNSAFQICLQFKKGNSKLSTKFLKMEKYAPAFVKSQQRKTVRQFGALYMVSIQYTNNKQVKNSNEILVIVEFLHRPILGHFRCFSPRKVCCEDWYY